MALVIKPADNIAALGKQIASEFVVKLKDLKLSQAEQSLIDRAGQRLAAAAVLSPGAPREVQDRLAIDRDNAVAVMANVLAAKAIQAEQLIRQTAFEVLARSVQLALGLVVAAA